MLLWHEVEVEVVTTHKVRVLANNEKEAMLEVASWESRDVECWGTESTRLVVTGVAVSDPLAEQEG